MERGTPTLGVCLGALLLAAAAGGEAHAGGAPKVEWGTVTTTPAAAADALFADVAPGSPALVWQTDTFELPPGAVLLAESTQYRNQAFRVGERAWGVQFHLEIDAEGVEAFAAAVPEEADEAPQGAEGLVAAARRGLSEAGPRWADVLRRFARLAAS